MVDEIDVLVKGVGIARDGMLGSGLQRFDGSISLKSPCSFRKFFILIISEGSSIQYYSYLMKIYFYNNNYALLQVT